MLVKKGWILFLFIFSLSTGAQGFKNKYLIEAFKFYKTGSYKNALDSLKSARGSKKILGTRFYLEGIILNRLQRYDEAVDSFKKSIRYGNITDDLYYEFGQALYANSDLDGSRKAFQMSANKKFKENSSLYYVAHISQLLEEHKLAKVAYAKLIKNAEKDKKLKQIAQFQISESFLALAEARDDASRLVEKYVIPRLKAAFATLPKAPLAKDIEKRRKEIEKRYGLDPNLMKNGRVLSQKRFNTNFSHSLSYDSNITLATDVPTAASLQKDTFIHSTNINFQRLFSFAGRYTVTPFLKGSNSYHTDRENSTVHQNDTHTWTSGFDMTHEHSIFGRQANFLFGFNYNYTGRDTNGRKDNQFFARALNFSVGERLRFIATGPTTFKFTYKDYQAYLATINNKTIGFSINQIKGLSGGNMLMVMFSASFIDQYNNTNSSTDNYLLRLDYIAPQVFTNYTLSTSLTTSFLDTKAQKATRGIEKSITPSISLKRALGSTISASLGYDFTRNISKNKTSFDYKKHVVRFELSASY